MEEERELLSLTKRPLQPLIAFDMFLIFAEKIHFDILEEPFLTGTSHKIFIFFSWEKRCYVSYKQFGHDFLFQKTPLRVGLTNIRTKCKCFGLSLPNPVG